MRLKFVPPLLPTLVEKPPEGEGWIHEVKFEGYRSQIVRDEDSVRPHTWRSQGFGEILEDRFHIQTLEPGIGGSPVFRARSFI